MLLLRFAVTRLTVALCLSVGVATALTAQSRSGHEVALRNKDVVMRIQSLIQAGDLFQAKTVAETALQQAPHEGGLKNLLGIIAVSQHDNAAAAMFFHAAMADNPGLISAYLNLARLYLENPQIVPEAEEKARTLYERVLARDRHSAEANAELALIEERHAQYSTAVQHLNAIEGESSSLLLGALRCGGFGALKQKSQADLACNDLATNPELSEGDAMIAISGLRQGARADLILRLLSAVKQRQPLSPEGTRLLALAEDALGDSEVARATLEQAFAASPQSSALLVDLADIAQHQKKWQDALGYLAHARELQPRDASIHLRFAEACIALGLLGEARNAMESALKLDPKNPDYNLTMGKVTALSQDPLRAKPFLETYHALRPADPKGELLLGVIEYRVKEFASARPWLLKASQNPSTAAEANLYLGSSYRQLGELSVAQAYLEQSERQYSDDPEVHAEMGLLALQKHDNTHAERELAKAVALDLKSYSGNFGLLQLYARTGDSRRAEQLKRFEAIKEQNETLNRQSMRVIEVRPDSPTSGEKP